MKTAAALTGTGRRAQAGMQDKVLSPSGGRVGRGGHSAPLPLSTPASEHARNPPYLSPEGERAWPSPIGQPPQPLYTPAPARLSSTRPDRRRPTREGSPARARSALGAPAAVLDPLAGQAPSPTCRAPGQ